MNYLIAVLNLADSADRLYDAFFFIVCRAGTMGESPEDVAYITVWGLIFLAVLCVLLLAGGVWLSKTRLFGHMALSAEQTAQEGYTARIYPANLIGQQATAQTPLRPAGKAVIGAHYYDVITSGTYVESGATVVVTGTEGSSLTVRPLQQP